MAPIQSANADDDDYPEQIEDATGEPLQTDMSYYVDRKHPPIRLTAKEEIEWGEFNNTDLTTFRTTATGEIQFPITKKYFAEVLPSIGITNTNFSGDGQFIDIGKSSGDPWSDLYEFSFRFRSKYLLNDRWGFVTSSWTTSRWEQRLSFDDGMSVNPFGQFSWKIDERHTLSTTGLGIKLRSSWNEVITTNIYAKYASRRWRLDNRKDGVVDQGSLRDRKVPIGMGLQWKFLEGWQLRVDLGIVAYRQLQTTDDDGDSVDTETSNAPGVYGSLLLRRRF